MAWFPGIWFRSIRRIAAADAEPDPAPITTVIRRLPRNGSARRRAETLGGATAPGIESGAGAGQ